jgi:hypothetical protein
MNRFRQHKHGVYGNIFVFTWTFVFVRKLKHGFHHYLRNVDHFYVEVVFSSAAAFVFFLYLEIYYQEFFLVFVYFYFFDLEMNNFLPSGNFQIQVSVVLFDFF